MSMLIMNNYSYVCVRVRAPSACTRVTGAQASQMDLHPHPCDHQQQIRPPHPQTKTLKENRELRNNVNKNKPKNEEVKQTLKL